MAGDDLELARQIHRELNSRTFRRRRGEDDHDDSSKHEQEESSSGSEDESENTSQGSQKSDESDSKRRKKLDKHEKQCLKAAHRAAQLPTHPSSTQQNGIQQQGNNAKAPNNTSVVKCFMIGIPWGIFIPKETLQTVDSLWQLMQHAHTSIEEGQSTSPPRQFKGAILVLSNGDIKTFEPQDDAEEWKDAVEKAARVYVQVEGQEGTPEVDSNGG